MRERTRARLTEDIARHLADILEFDVKDPVLRAAAPTVMAVRLSPDGAEAVVYVYVEGTSDERAKVLAALAHDHGFLRTQLAQRLSVRRVPKLTFELDETLDRALRLEELFGEDHRG